MSSILIVIGILAALWVFGKIILGVQDQKELEINPNHPSKLSKRIFPVSSGTCRVRNGDRHIWDYGHYEDEWGPSRRCCKYCGEIEFRMLTTNTNEWRGF